MVMIVGLFAFDWYGKVNWAMNWQSAKEVAKKEHKLIMVDIASTHCPYCKKLAAHYADKKIADYINKHFVPLLYLADKEYLPKEVARNFRGGVPTLMFFTPDGKLKRYIVGYYPKEFFLNILKQIK